MSAASALSCEGVRVRYGGIQVLHDVGLAVAYGTLSALIGPNGAGKTTLLDWCAGAATESSGSGGRLRIEGAEASAWHATRRARAGLRYVPFDRNVFPGLSVRDNLRATGAAHETRGGGARGGVTRRWLTRGEATSDSMTTANVLERFPELSRLVDRPAGVLSGGERQLLAVACALHGPARILLIDEPTHALAPDLADRVIEALAETARQHGRAILLAEPSMSQALRAHTDFSWPLDRGRRLPADGA